MSRLLTTCAVGLLLSGCGAALPRATLWDDIEALQHDEERQAAEQRIQARGRDGLTGLLLAARALGEERALHLVSDPHFGHQFHASVEPEMRASSSGRAARLANGWLGREPGLAVELARSALWFERALAASSQLGKPAGLMAVMDALGVEPHPEVNQVLSGVIEGTIRRPSRDDADLEALRKRHQQLQIAEAWDDARCRSDAKGFAELVDRFLAGQLKKGTHSASSTELRIHLRRPDGRDVTLGPECALALHQALAGKDARHPELVVPLLNWGVVPEALKRRAVKLVLADLEVLPPDERNLAMARIVNAGGEILQRVQPVRTGSGFEITEILEATARQDPEAARPHLEHFWLCSEVFGNTELVALSGFLDSPEAAKEAYEIGLLCEHGLEPAIIALLRMGDGRALELLDRRLNKDFPPISTEVVYALREHRDQALEARLQARADSGNEQARRILASW